MKKARLNLKIAVWMLMGMLAWSLPQMQVHAKIQNGEEVSLVHIHTGNTAEKGGCYTVPVYHSHTGSFDAAGGCYTVPVSCGGSVTAKTSSVKCGDMNAWYGPNADHTESKWWATCGSCGALLGPHDSNDFGPHMRTETYFSCDRCGMRHNGEGICMKTVGYTTGCGKDDEIESYEIGCGYSICGSMRITNQDTAFARKTILTCDVLSEEAGCSITGYTWSDGSSSATVTVAENGVYTCVITYKDNYSGEIGSAEAVISVNNIDRQGPAVSVNQTPTEWTKESVILTAIAQDDQSGLHENAYRWNGGEWQSAAEYVVTENGTYTLKVRDRLGNETEHIFNISNIDAKGPAISAGQSTTEWTNESVLLTVTAQDDQSGLHENAYSWDGGIWQSEAEYVVTENGTYTLKVRDQLGNETEHIFNISNIDVKGPAISAGQSTTEWTNESVLLTVTAQDDQSGLHENAYRWNGSEWQSAAEHAVTENGTYTLRVRDRIGNESEFVFVITNIDCRLPVIRSWSLSTTELTSGPVELTVTAMDAESGLAEQAYSIDGLHWQCENVFTINENGIYNIYVQDKAGNITSLADTEEVITISNIRTPEPEKPKAPMPEPSVTTPVITADTEAPIVRLVLAVENWTEGINKILVTAYDSQSGLAKEAYSYDGGLTWTDVAELEIVESGIYVVFVRDTAGNVALGVIEAVKIVSVTGQQQQDDENAGDPPALFTLSSETEKQPRQTGTGIEWEMLQEQPKETDIWRPEITQPIVQIEETETPKDSTYQHHQVDIGKIVAAVAGTVTSGGIIIFFILWSGTWVTVYARRSISKEYKRVGRARLQRKKEAYHIRISHAIVNRAETNLFEIKFRKQFAKKHNFELLRIYGTDEAQVDCRVEEKVMFHI